MNRPLVTLIAASFLIGAAFSQPPANVNWLIHGRTYDDQRFSPLNQINEQTVDKLGLAWSLELGTNRGLEATPLVENGILYTTGIWSTAYAIDAKTGKTIWTYDPKVPRERAYFACCDVVNRGVALLEEKLFLGTIDGRLIALDKNSGKPIWSVQTTDTSKPYTITAAPRVIRGMVIIGNGGAEYGVRGYVSAYNAATGKMVWRVYTVPGDPAKGFESKALRNAAQTWHGEWWKTGGGGSAWEAMTYDPALDLFYFGTGNATAWYRALRGGGDNLYTASIVAVHAANGEFAWHFQTTPGDNWDFDATQPLVQADLSIAGRSRKVIMQANKNGFFYVFDRQTGEFLSGTPFVSGISWTKGLDEKTGRPFEGPSFADGKPLIVSPDPNGAHNWFPMAFNPSTGLVYLPAKNGTQMLHAANPKWKYNPDRDNTGIDETYDGPLAATLQSMPAPTGELLAWDPIARKAAWHAKYPVLEGGGVLTTAGNLVFQGRADGIFAAYRATDGKELWRFDTATGILAPAVTYTVDGVQYLSVMAGWGGVPGLFNFPGSGPAKLGYGRILTFTLGGTATLKALPFQRAATPPMPTITTTASSQTIQRGAQLFNSQCMGCHGFNAVAGQLPDLRYSSAETLEKIESIVLGGARASAGMPSFQKILTPAQVQAIQAYIITRARESASLEQPK